MLRGSSMGRKPFPNSVDVRNPTPQMEVQHHGIGVSYSVPVTPVCMGSAKGEIKGDYNIH